MKTIIDEKTNPRMANPPHPGEFIRTEIIEALELSVTAAARILRGFAPCAINPAQCQSQSVR